MELARRQPREREGLAAVPGIPRPFLSGEPARALMSAIARAQDLPDDALPEIRRGERIRVTPEFEQAVRGLRDARDRVAQVLDLDPVLLAPRGALEAVAARKLAGEPLDSVHAMPELRTWQAALLLPVWRAA